jgi:glutamate racemase
MLEPMLVAGVDVVVLGCTHYPFLREEIQEFVGPEVAVIDSGAAIARRVASVLRANALLLVDDGDVAGSFLLSTSAPADGISRVASLLLGEHLPAEEVECSGYSNEEEPVSLCELTFPRKPALEKNPEPDFPQAMVAQ